VRIYFSCDKIITKIIIHILNTIPDKVTGSRLCIVYMVCVCVCVCDAAVRFNFGMNYAVCFCDSFLVFMTHFCECLFLKIVYIGRAGRGGAGRGV